MYSTIGVLGSLISKSEAVRLHLFSLHFYLVFRILKTVLSPSPPVWGSNEIANYKGTWYWHGHSSLSFYAQVFLLTLLSHCLLREQVELLSLMCLIHDLTVKGPHVAHNWYFLASSEAIFSVKSLETVFPAVTYCKKNPDILCHQ